MINLLPPDIKESRLFASRNIAMARAASFLLATILFLGAMFGYGYLTLANTARSVTQVAAQKQQELGSIDTIQKQAQSLADTISTASALLNRETKFSDLIKDIGGLMPPGASLKGLKLTGDKTQPLEITANLSSLNQAAVLQKNLLSSNLFETADILSVDRKAETDSTGKLIAERPEAAIQVTFKKTTNASTAQKSKSKLPETFKP